MNLLRLLALAALAAMPAFAQQPAPAPSGAYVSDPAHTSLTWKIGHFGLSNYTARFTGIAAELAWNAENPAASTLTATIDPASVRTDFPFPEVEDFDGKIGRGGDFLAGQPIRFVSTAIAVTGPKTGKVTGDLTFRGQTHPAVLDVTFNGSMAEHPMEKAPKLGFSATATIRRSDWGLGIYLPVLSDDVTILIETEFAPPKKAVN